MFFDDFALKIECVFCWLVHYEVLCLWQFKTVGCKPNWFGYLLRKEALLHRFFLFLFYFFCAYSLEDSLLVLEATFFPEPLWAQVPQETVMLMEGRILPRPPVNPTVWWPALGYVILNGKRGFADVVQVKILR